MSGGNRFAHLSKDQLTSFKKKKVAKSTNAGTSNAVRTFLAFCQELNIYSINIIEKEELKETLTKFYAGARTENGELYKINSLHAMRSGLQRHFQETRQIDIINDDFFRESNACFTNMLAMVRTTVKGPVNHHPEIEPEDLTKLYTSINTNTPTGLLEKVWIDIMLHFIRRGAQNLRTMTKQTFALGTDAAGKCFIYQSSGEIDKNHDVDDDQSDTTGEGRIYETGAPLCPLRSFLLYICKLHPDQDALWQRPKESYNETDETWYSKVPLGPKSLGNMLSKMSVKYNLSQRYTNHSLRVTGVQALEDANIEGRHIVRITGHKSQDSIKHYARRLSASRKRNISSILSGALDKENVIPSSIIPPKTQKYDQVVPDKNIIQNVTSTTSAMNVPTTCTAVRPSSVSRDPCSSSVISDINFDISSEDDDLFAEVPSNLLSSTTSQNQQRRQAMHMVSSSLNHQPIFHNCAVTINYNFYNK